MKTEDNNKEKTEIESTKNGVLQNISKYGCGCNTPYPRYLPAKNITKCMNCRVEY